jgi:hypothetical protein
MHNGHRTIYGHLKRNLFFHSVEGEKFCVEMGGVELSVRLFFWKIKELQA